jgi:hypothetical protein
VRPSEVAESLKKRKIVAATQMPIRTAIGQRPVSKAKSSTVIAEVKPA